MKTLLQSMKIQKGSNNKIFKFADRNHLKKNFMKKIYELKLKHNELRKKFVIKHIKKLFNFAIHQNNKNTAGLKEILLSIPNHLFGQHRACGTWCVSSLNSRKRIQKFHSVVFKSPALHDDLKNVFQIYAKNAHKFCIIAMSQRNGCLSSVIVIHFPKNKNYKCLKQGDIRVRAGIIHFNAGYQSAVRVKHILKHSPGVNTKNFVRQADRQRLNEGQKRATREYKSRRSLQMTEREKRRMKTESIEGTNYEFAISYQQLCR